MLRYLIGFAAGFVTAISPCVLPVLPLVLGGGVSGGRRRPLAIVAGLVVSFTVFTLFAVALLDALGLPKDFLRNLALVLLLVVAAGLIFPALGHLLERPFYRLGPKRPVDAGGGFALGIGLGLVFVPCAGPVLGAISAEAARSEFGWDVGALMFAYALGAATPLLAVAVAGQRAAERTRALRTHAVGLRRAAGVVIAATALAIALELDKPFQTAVPGYTQWFQREIEESPTAKRELAEVRGGTQRLAGLRDFGPAPDLIGINRWLNTPGERALTLAELRGKVVVIDFWTYSCINCLRTLPHLKAWYGTYHARGLEIVGVHTPEFAFEHEVDNVRAAVKRLGLRYPVALDNDFNTFDAYRSEGWPTKFILDRRGRVRFAHFGEGAYDETERIIRQLLAERGARLPEARRVADATPRELLTPESYLGYQRADRLANDSVLPDQLYSYELAAAMPLHNLSYGGTWRVEEERIVAGNAARLRIHFRGRQVFLVLAGTGRVAVRLDGRAHGDVRVDGDRLYTLLELPRTTNGLLELRLTAGLAAYAFTFG